MINIVNKEDCCGCSACSNICPKSCISMKRDNEGFLYPSIDEDICINCNLCEKVCPVINVAEDKPKKQYAYLVQNKNEKIRKESTSGGAFTAIAEAVIEKGGVVFGVAYNDELMAVHKYVENKEDLRLFRNSKYVQSTVGNSYKKAKEFLDKGRWVCFSGTPCQIEGLHTYLGKDYENLILVDIVCHAVPSPLIWQKYLEGLRKKYGDKITNILFRDKSFYGYKYSQISVYNNGDCLQHKGVETDFMLRSFFSDICDRPSCYSCKFKKRYRVSDITMWDCFTVDDFDKNLDDDKGTTRILIQSEKGKELFDECRKVLKCVEFEPDKMVDKVKEMFHSVNMNNKRESFFADAQTMSVGSLAKKYFPDSLKVKIERFVRITTFKLGIYSKVKKIAKKLLGK